MPDRRRSHRGGGLVTATRTARAGRPLPAWLRNLSRLADTNGWDSLSYRVLGAGDGYLFTRGMVEIDIRANDAGRISRAIWTSPGRPALDPRVGRGEAARTWLTDPPLTSEQPRRFTRVHRALTGGINLVTYDDCRHCGGRITNSPLIRRPGDTNTWVHLHDEDWVDDVHHATPAGGLVTDADQPGPWLIAGAPR